MKEVVKAHRVGKQDAMTKVSMQPAKLMGNGVGKKGPKG